MMSTTQRRVGLIGYGSIGQAVTEYLARSAERDVVICGALVRNSAPSHPPSTVPMFARLEDFLAVSPNIVVEVAGRDALSMHGPAVLRAGIDLLVASVGGLADSDLVDRLSQSAELGKSHLRYVAGSIGALDAVAAAAIGGLDEVALKTSKPARTLLPIDEARHLSAPRVIFEGSARQATNQFPESLNVAAALSLSGIGFDRTRVSVVADPAIETNRHEIHASGYFGTLTFSIQGIPSDRNPKTARLVSMSVARALLRGDQRIVRM